jgi:hypothetical protein
VGTVIWHVTMSLDGFIAGPDDSRDWVVAQWRDGGENIRDIDVQRSAVADAAETPSREAHCGASRTEEGSRDA